MNKASDLSWMQTIGLLLAAFLFGCFITWLFLKFPPTDSGHIAAWVQAFGSIGAIGSAIYVFKNQAEHQQRMQHDEWAKRREEKLMVSKRVYAPVALSVLSVVLSELQRLTEECARVNDSVTDINNINRMKPILNSLRVRAHSPNLEFLYVEDTHVGTVLQEIRSTLNLLCAHYDPVIHEAQTGKKSCVINLSNMLQEGGLSFPKELEKLIGLCDKAIAELKDFIQS